MGLDENQLIEIQNVVREEMGNPFGDCSTEYKIKQLLAAKCGMVEPVRLVLGTEWCWKRKATDIDLVKSETTCYYIPLAKSLQQLLCNNEILKCTTARDNCRCHLT